MPRRCPVAGARSGVPPPHPSRPWSTRHVVLNLDLKYSQHPTTGNPCPPAPPSHRGREGWPAPRRPRTRPGPGPEACRQSCSWGRPSHFAYPANHISPTRQGSPGRLHGGLWGVAHTDCTPPTRRRPETRKPPRCTPATFVGSRGPERRWSPGRSHITYPAKPSGRCPGASQGTVPGRCARPPRMLPGRWRAWIGLAG